MTDKAKRINEAKAYILVTPNMKLYIIQNTL